jgi:hypothetical protein
VLKILTFEFLSLPLSGCANSFVGVRKGTDPLTSEDLVVTFSETNRQIKRIKGSENYHMLEDTTRK